MYNSNPTFPVEFSSREGFLNPITYGGGGGALLARTTLDYQPQL